jgi:hypothetical protein
VRIYKNMHPLDFCVPINSRGIGKFFRAIRECAFLGVPAVNIGSRQRGGTAGAMLDVDYSPEAIKTAVERMWSGGERPRDMIYGDGPCRGRIAEVLATAEL